VAFTKVGLDASLASGTFGKVVTGNASLKITPEVVDLLSKESRDESMLNWIVCDMQQRSLIASPAQAAYTRDAAHFFAASPQPTADQILQWRRENPFPAGSNRTLPIHGQVVDKGGKGIPHVQVVATYSGQTIASGLTDESGTFQFTVPLEYYDTPLDLRYALTGFAAGSQQVRVTDLTRGVAVKVPLSIP
jgi:hypothetical protein